jgi:hypothetical protein
MCAELDARPGPDEFGPFYAGYIERAGSGSIVSRLVEQEARIARLFSGMDPARLGFRYAEGKWTPREILGHLSDTERVMSYRMLRVARGDATPLPGFDENPYVAAAGFDRREIGSLLDEFRSVRAATLSLVRSIEPARWLLRGTASGAPVSTRALAWIVVGHANHHLQILDERYRPDPAV